MDLPKRGLLVFWSIHSAHANLMNKCQLYSYFNLSDLVQRPRILKFNHEID